jgi:hypothetical protein
LNIDTFKNKNIISRTFLDIELGGFMNNDSNQMDFSGHILNLEDAENIQLPTPTNKTITDHELEQAGLIKTSAFVRTKRSKNALRVEKSKQKKAESGVKQLNIEVPEQHRELFKSIAKDLTSTGTINQNSIESLSKLVKTSEDVARNNDVKHTDEHRELPPSLSIEFIQIGNKCAKIAAQGGFKAWLLKKII